MKSQQGFAFIAGTAWLAAAALTGGFVAAVESGTKDETTVTAQNQAQPSIAVAAIAPAAQETPAMQQTSYIGTSLTSNPWTSNHDGDHHFEE